MLQGCHQALFSLPRLPARADLPPELWLLQHLVSRELQPLVGVGGKEEGRRGGREGGREGGGAVA